MWQIRALSGAHQLPHGILSFSRGIHPFLEETPRMFRMETPREPAFQFPKNRVRLCPLKVGIWRHDLTISTQGSHVPPAGGKEAQKTVKQMPQQEADTIERQGKRWWLSSWSSEALSPPLAPDGWWGTWEVSVSEMCGQAGDPDPPPRRPPGMATLTTTSLGSAKTSADVSWCVLRSSDENGSEILSSVFSFQPHLCFIVVAKKRSFCSFLIEVIYAHSQKKMLENADNVKRKEVIWSSPTRNEYG